MLLSEASVRKIIKAILMNESGKVDRGASNLQTIQSSEDDSRGDTPTDKDTTPEEYSPAKKANLSGLKQNTLDFIKRIKSYAKEKNYTPEPFVTSGFRNADSQAAVMFKNWKIHGGKENDAGTKYLIGLYKNDNLAKEIGDSFTKTGNASNAIAILSRKPISSHGTGKAIDIRSKGHPNIGEIIYAVAAEFKEKNINVYVNDETKYKNPHYHIKVG